MKHLPPAAAASGPLRETHWQPIGAPYARSDDSKAKRGISAVALPLCIALWFQATLIWTGSDQHSVIAVAAAAAGCVGVHFHHRLLASPLLYYFLVVGLGALLAVKALAFPLPTINQGFGIIPRTWTFGLAEFLLCCQVLVLWGRTSRDRLPASWAGLAVATSVCALDTIFVPKDRTLFVVLATASFLVPALVMMRTTEDTRSRVYPLSRRTRFLLAVICGVIVLSSWSVTDVWSRWLPNARYWLFTKVGQSHIQLRSLTYYVSSGSLTAIRSEMSVDPDRTALRVYCDRRPGYLAGRIFDEYANGRWDVYSEPGWRSRDKKLVGVRVLEPAYPLPDELAVAAQSLAAAAQRGEPSTFVLDSQASTLSLLAMVIHNDPRRGQVFFTPLGCRVVQGFGRTLSVDSHGIVRGGVSVRWPYAALVNLSAVPQPLTAQQRVRLSTPLQGMDDRIAALARQVCAQARDDQEKIQAVGDFLQDNFEYSLDPVVVPRGREPISHFLLSRQPAHCEFFASAAVALLRLQGIPARYATGFRVMQREEDDGDYWIARNQNAHAWAEAFDDRKQQWVIVEATPGYTAPADLEAARVNQLADGGGGTTGQRRDADNADLFTSWIEGLPLGLGGAIALPVIFITGLTTLLISSWRARSVTDLEAAKTTHPQRHQLRQLLRRMDRRVKRRGLVRRPAETLHQFARRISSPEDAQDTWLQECAAWYLTYAGVRFGSPHQTPPPLPPKSRR